MAVAAACASHELPRFRKCIIELAGVAFHVGVPSGETGGEIGNRLIRHMRNGLQSRLRRFDSDPSLHTSSG